MNHVAKIITRLILPLLVIIISFVPGNAAEIDDSAVFVEAFNAYMQKDYLLAIEKCDLLNQVFPDSPLRDVTLLLIARASLKSGENERAAKSVALFLTEFSESSLKTSVGDELNVLASRYQKGEILAADKTLQSAASKVFSDRLVREHATELKMDMEQASIKAAIKPHESAEPVPVGGNGTLPIEIPKVGQAETGKLAEINLDLKVREDSAVGQELRGHK